MEVCIKDKENKFWLYPYALMCVSTVYPVHLMLCEKYHRHITQVGFESTIFENLEQCLTYQD